MWSGKVIPRALGAEITSPCLTDVYTSSPANYLQSTVCNLHCVPKNKKLSCHRETARCLVCNHRLQITDQNHNHKITDRSFRHASPRLWNELPESFRQPNQSPPQFTCSFTCQPILIIISTLRIHHTFTLSLEGQNLPLQQILPTLTLLLYSLDCLQGTEADLSCSSVYFYFFFFYIFCSF